MTETSRIGPAPLELRRTSIAARSTRARATRRCSTRQASSGSTSCRGNCSDKAVAESFFKTLEAELGEAFDSRSNADRQLFDCIEVIYNQHRTHSSIRYKSPVQFERTNQSAALAA